MCRVVVMHAPMMRHQRAALILAAGTPGATCRPAAPARATTTNGDALDVAIDDSADRATEYVRRACH